MQVLKGCCTTLVSSLLPGVPFLCWRPGVMGRLAIAGRQCAIGVGWIAIFGGDFAIRSDDFAFGRRLNGTLFDFRPWVDLRHGGSSCGTAQTHISKSRCGAPSFSLTQTWATRHCFVDMTSGWILFSQKNLASGGLTYAVNSNRCHHDLHSLDGKLNEAFCTIMWKRNEWIGCLLLRYSCIR